MIIAQLSDPHISLEQGVLGSAEVVAQHLRRAVAHLLRLAARPDVVIVSGDCVDRGHPAEYARFQELVRPLPMPVYVVPGNHDDRSQMLRHVGTQGAHALDGFVQYLVEEGPVRLIALDTLVPGSGRGLLCARRLAWLEQRLEEGPARPTLVWMHHPPFRTGLAAYDEIGLEGDEAFAALIARHPQVERVVCGHVHMALTRRFAGTTVMTCPSTTQTLTPDTTRPERVVVLVEPPACLLHVWNERTGLTTSTSRIGEDGPVVELHDGDRWIAGTTSTS